MTYLADIRDGRYRITTARLETHEWAGRRVYQYLCAVHEGDGFFVGESAIEAESVMRLAYKNRGSEFAFGEEQLLEYLGCNHQVACADCDDCIKSQGRMVGS